jgi:hypothetical protein
MDKSITSSFGGFKNAVLDLISMVESYHRVCFEIDDKLSCGVLKPWKKSDCQ